MPANRFFCSDPLVIDSMATVREVEHHHLANVMRCEIGSLIELVDGKGTLAAALIEKRGRHETIARVKSVAKEMAPQKKFIIAQAIPRPSKLETIVEKCTELGMDELWLFPGKKSEKGTITPSQEKRMIAIAIGAMKQSGRLYLPKIVVKEHFSKWKEKPSGALFFGDLAKEAPTLLSLSRENKEEKRIFFIGPEAGFSNDEEEMLRKIGAVGTKLHSNILRTETAPIVVLSIWGQL